MTKLENSSNIMSLQYEWKLNGMKEKAVSLSKKIKYKENDSFQAGFRKLSNAPLSTPIRLFLWPVTYTK